MELRCFSGDHIVHKVENNIFLAFCRESFPVPILQGEPHTHNFLPLIFARFVCGSGD
jgi:hypothetical protein